jgi:hypothetical protein
MVEPVKTSHIWVANTTSVHCLDVDGYLHATAVLDGRTCEQLVVTDRGVLDIGRRGPVSLMQRAWSYRGSEFDDRLGTTKQKATSGKKREGGDTA